ncbi:MAG: response regulator transcription factor [bacterium]|nr:response regulator transcription factor [bacterium]MCP4964827.1 response regulator transcription factor [bacterium]
MAIRVLVVDDHFVVRAGIASFIDSQEDMTLVGEAGTCDEAISATEKLAPDVVLMDIRLDDCSGIDVTRKIKATYPQIKVVMFTTYADLELLRTAIEAGASGYVIKRMALHTLVDTVRRVVSGEDLVIDERAQVALDTGGPEAALTERLRRLSPQEQRVLSLISDGLTNRQIADELSLAEKTVKNYVSALLHKLDMTRRAEAAAFRAAITDIDDPE